MKDDQSKLRFYEADMYGRELKGSKSSFEGVFLRVVTMGLASATKERHDVRTVT